MARIVCYIRVKNVEIVRKSCRWERAAHLHAMDLSLVRTAAKSQHGCSIGEQSCTIQEERPHGTHEERTRDRYRQVVLHAVGMDDTGTVVLRKRIARSA